MAEYLASIQRVASSSLVSRSLYEKAKLLKGDDASKAAGKLATYSDIQGRADTSTVINSGEINWPGALYSTPTTASIAGHKISFAPALASQSAYTLFGRAASTGVPSFLASIDSNFIPTLHSEGYYNTKYITASSTVTLTNKRWTARVGSTTSSATPTINTDNYDIYKLTAQTTDITSFTTNLSGTPVDGDILEIQITGTATRAITWGSSFVSSTVTLPATTSSTATLSVILQYYTTSSYGTNKWVCVNYY